MVVHVHLQCVKPGNGAGIHWLYFRLANEGLSPSFCAEKCGPDAEKAIMSHGFHPSWWVFFDKKLFSCSKLFLIFVKILSGNNYCHHLFAPHCILLLEQHNRNLKHRDMTLT